MTGLPPYSHFKSERDRLRDVAWRLTRLEIREGRLPPPSSCKCVDCGEPAYCYDHRDYRRPIDVDPVCRACNLRRGPGLPLPTRADNAEHKIDKAIANARSDEGGEGFEPLSAHLNGITADDLEQIILDTEANATLEEIERVRIFEETSKGIGIFHNGEQRGFRRVVGGARAAYFKRRDPWYA